MVVPGKNTTDDGMLLLLCWWRGCCGGNEGKSRHIQYWWCHYQGRRSGEYRHVPSFRLGNHTVTLLDTTNNKNNNKDSINDDGDDLRNEQLIERANRNCSEIDQWNETVKSSTSTVVWTMIDDRSSLSNVVDAVICCGK